MAQCDGFDNCSYFTEFMGNMPSTAALTQSNYCKNNFAECARYRIWKTIGEAAVPADLSPSESEQADKIIANNK
jgi:hypothetical protein